MTDRPRIQTAFERLDAWVVGRDFSGWDPHDALNSPWLRTLVGPQRRAGQVIVQALKRSPLNMRPLLGVAPGRNPKGIGLFLASYCREFERTGRPVFLARARELAGWLTAHRATSGPGASWGYNFPWPNRDFFAPAGTPTLVNTAFIGLAFVMMHDVLNRDDPSAALAALVTAGDACRFVLSGLNRLQDTADELCLSYTPIDRRVVHNANVLGGWLLAEVSARTNEPELAREAIRIARFTTRRQRADATWPYGESSRDGFVDNFHTAYVLMALRRIGRRTGTAEFDQAVSAGFASWQNTFFLSDGTPRYYRDRTCPVDAHGAAQAILTFLEFSDVPESTAAAGRTARWTLDHMQDPAGFFYYQRTKWYTNRIPYMRWVQAWMHRALSELLWREARRSA